MKTNEIPKALMKEAKESRDFLKGLKSIAVNCQKYELAAALRDVEVKQFPRAKTTNANYTEAETFKTLLNIAELNLKHTETAYLVLAIAKIVIKKGGESALKDVAKIQAEVKEIFG